MAELERAQSDAPKASATMPRAGAAASAAALQSAALAGPSSRSRETTAKPTDVDVEMQGPKAGQAMSAKPEEHLLEGLPDWLIEVGENVIPMLSAIQVDLDESYVVARLVSLAQRYAFPGRSSMAEALQQESATHGAVGSAESSTSSGTAKNANGKRRALDEPDNQARWRMAGTDAPSSTATDFVSAAFYAHLALCIDADSTAARRLLA